MNYDSLEEGLAQPCFVHHAKLRALEEQLHSHVLDAIDFDALSGREQHLCLILCEDFGMATDLALDLSTQIIERSLHRAAESPLRYGDRGPPPGITEAERAAVAFDAACPFCAYDVQQQERAARPGGGEPEEFCGCCDELARSWREEHAEVLAKAGLAPPGLEGDLARAGEAGQRHAKSGCDPS